MHMIIVEIYKVCIGNSIIVSKNLQDKSIKLHGLDSALNHPKSHITYKLCEKVIFNFELDECMTLNFK